MRERAEEKAARYLEATSRSLKTLRLKKSSSLIHSSRLDYVLELARDYTRDTKHYLGDG